MRIAIDGEGYDVATAAFESANHLAASAYSSLTSRLADYAGMAGDDASSAQFAAAYDEVAAESVAAVGDLVGSFASLGRLATASLTNHVGANRASVVRSVSAGAVVVGSGAEGVELPEHGYATVLPDTPPGSLGGDAGSLPAQVDWILDRVEGFVWPNADTERLYAAAGTWRAAAADVADLGIHCAGAIAALGDEESPEVPLAIAATSDLADAARDVARQLGALAGACDDYADHVEEQRAAILDLVWSLLRDAVIIQGIGLVLGSVTAGLTAAGAAAANAAKIAAQAPRFIRILTVLRELTSTTATGLRFTLAYVRQVRDRLVKFHAARAAYRGEAGMIDLSKWDFGWLRSHEALGGHTLARHVGQSLADLVARLTRRPRLEAASSFADDAAAEAAIAKGLAKNADDVDTWMAGSTPRKTLVADLGELVGVVLPRGADLAVETTKVRIVLVRDASQPEGWRVLTAFPHL